MKNIVFFVMVVIASLLCPAKYGLLPDVKAQTDESNGLDGTWSIKERFCAELAGQRGCGTNEFDITISDSTVSVEDEEVGSVTQEGNKVSFEYNSEYLSSKFEEILKEKGYEADIESLTVKKYDGKIKNNRVSGKIKGTITAYFTLFQKSTTLKYTGNFKGKKQQ
jgi:hypothetical protein